MREIKFRIWDKTSNHMLYQDDFERVEIDTKNKIVVTIADVESNKAHYSLDYEDGIEAEIMQYTGLKDKNGKEIYECDLLKDVYGEIDEVVYDEYMFNLRNFYDSGYDIPSDAFSEGTNRFEVIGNIYENKELLEVEE